MSDGTTAFANSFSYTAHGGLTSETFGNGMVHALEYNRRLQASKITLKQSSSATSPLQQYDYGYGQFNSSTGTVDTSKNNGQIGKVVGTIGTTTQWLQGFSYDSIGRLSTVAEYQGGNMSSQTYSQGYTYDRYGNRFQSANTTLGLPAVSSSEIDASTNRFVNSGSTPTTYDPAGNILSDAKFRGMNYSYDANNRQTLAERSDHTNQQASVYDCAGQRVQTTANGTTRTMVYDIFGQNVVEYSNGSLERENIYRGGQLLAVSEPLITAAAAPSELAAVPSGGGVSITLSWSAAAGATNYRVARATSKDGPYQLVGTTSSTGFTDTTVSGGNAYLYKVCAADGQGNCTSGYSNIAMSATVTFPTDPTITTFAEDPANATRVKAAHITELRAAVNAVRRLAGMPDATWTNPTLTPGMSVISADDVRDLRNRLYEALAALRIQTSAYTDQMLAGAPNGTLIKGAHIRELRQRATMGVSPCYKTITQFVADFYQGTLHRQPSSSELSSWTATLTQAQAQGESQLIAAAQSLGTTLFTSTEYGNLNTSNAQFITDLYAGFLQRAPDTDGYNFWLGVLNGGASRVSLIPGFADSIEFQDNVKALCWAAGTSGGVKYVLSDVQGSTRAVMNNNGVGTSSIVARHDYIPFGEEISAGTGLRTAGQGYGALDTNRWKYGLLERDATTGLDHTWWRKYESFAGRWTSPDPYRGSMSIANPQSFNLYAYVDNDPANFVDPTGLYWAIDWGSCRTNWVWKPHIEGGGDWVDRGEICNLVWVDDRPIPAPQEPRPVPRPRPTPKPKPVNSEQQRFNECAKKAHNDFTKAQFISGGKVLLGTGMVIGSLMFTGGLPSIGMKVAKGSIAAMIASAGAKAGATARATASLTLIPYGGDLFVQGIKEGNANQARLNAELAKCKKKYPHADHSLTWLHGIGL